MLYRISLDKMNKEKKRKEKKQYFWTMFGERRFWCDEQQQFLGFVSMITSITFKRCLIFFPRPMTMHFACSLLKTISWNLNVIIYFIFDQFKIE